MFPEAMANLRGLFSAALPERIPDLWVGGISLAASGLLYLGILMLWRGELDPLSRRFDRLTAVTLLGTLLISYHLNPQDLSLMFLPLALAFAAAERAPEETAFGGYLLLGATLAFALAFLYGWGAEGKAFFLVALPLLLLLAATWVDLIRLRTPMATKGDRWQL